MKLLPALLQSAVDQPAADHAMLTNDLDGLITAYTSDEIIRQHLESRIEMVDMTGVQCEHGPGDDAFRLSGRKHGVAQLIALIRDGVTHSGTDLLPMQRRAQAFQKGKVGFGAIRSYHPEAARPCIGPHLEMLDPSANLAVGLGM
jgi:hypothetical protein